MSKRLSAVQPQLIVLCVAMIFVGIVLRFWDLGFPNSLTWDEHHFVKNARNYLAGRPDWNDHPPLGKLLIALSIHHWEDTSLAFRLPSACLGAISVGVAGLLARSVFRSNVAGLLGAAFIAVDGFHIAYSRTALLDGMLTALTLLALWIMTLPGWLPILLAGWVVGSAMAIKMSALTLFGPFIAVALLHLSSSTKLGSHFFSNTSLFGRPLGMRKVELFMYLPAVGVAFTVYLWWWTIGLEMAGQSSSFTDAVRATQKMMEHHARLTDWEHPLLSRWWTWGVPTKPILLRHDTVSGGMLRIMSTMGNPLIWWSVIIGVFFTFWRLIESLLLRRAPALGQVWLLLAYVAYLSPWIVTNRDSYIYHYLPSYAVGIILLAGLISEFALILRLRLAVLGLVCTVAVVSSLYAPVWAQLPISPNAVKYRPFIR